MTDLGSLAVTPVDLAAAAEAIRPFAVRTRLLTSPALDERTGARVFLKPEMLQRTGSFKFRGAYNKLSSIPPGSRGAGVVAFSSGNHAQGVAAAAQLFGMPATIVMPADSPKTKQERTRGYGAEVVLYDRDREDREAIARGLCEKRGATLVPPFDDPKVIAGQGTLGREIADDMTRAWRRAGHRCGPGVRRRPRRRRRHRHQDAVSASHGHDRGARRLRRSRTLLRQRPPRRRIPPPREPSAMH